MYQEYREIYIGREIKIYSICLEKNASYLFRVELLQKNEYGLDLGFSGVGLFVVDFPEIEKYCILLEKMYETLKGECTIQDHEFGNIIKLYFVGRNLKINGRLYDGTNTFLFGQYGGGSDDDGVNIDQTIIPQIISVLKSDNKSCNRTQFGPDI